MRLSAIPALTITAAALCTASAARAQQCVFPPVALPGDDGIPDFFTNNPVFLTSPPPGSERVPLNTELRLGGVVTTLDSPAQFEVQLLDETGARIPIERRGRVVRAIDLLRPDATYVARLAPTDTNPCPQCFAAQEVSFTTGVDVDDEAPVLDVVPDVFVFALPSIAEQQRCGIFNNQTHALVIDFGPQLPLDTWIAAAARHDDEEPVFAGEGYSSGRIFSLVTNAGDSTVALGDKFLVALTARDLAGNTSEAVVVGVRARSFRDAAIPRAELEDLSCTVDEGLLVRAPDDLPTNGRVLVEFPFEEVPVSLAPVDWDGDEDELIALFAVEDTRSGHVYQPAGDLVAGERYQVITRQCPHCVCEGCQLASDAEVVVGTARDTEKPRAPEVVELNEDIEPTISTDACKPDRPALVVVLKKGRDDTTDALSLRYGATVRIKDGVAYTLGAGHLAKKRSDGNVELRLETPGLPRLLGEPFTLTLTVEDAAGNSERTVVESDPDADGGCAAGGSASALAFLALALRRRSRARP